jgi:hypothetical protein
MGIFSRHPKVYATPAGATPGYAAPVQTAAPPAPAMAGGVVGTRQVTTTTTTTYATGAPPNSRPVDYAYGHKQPHHRHGAQAYDYAYARN